MFAHHAPRPFGAAIAARTDGQIEALGGFTFPAKRGTAGRGRREPVFFQRPAEFDRHTKLRSAAPFTPSRPAVPLSRAGAFVASNADRRRGRGLTGPLTPAWARLPRN